MKNLIYGKVNPSIVSRIKWYKGYRMDRVHPYFYRLHNKKYGLFAWKKPSGFIFDWWQKPTVEVFGSDGNRVLKIPCRSNAHAEKLKKELETQLDEWVGSGKYE